MKTFLGLLAIYVFILGLRAFYLQVAALVRRLLGRVPL